jgi:hypothetical protein
VAALVFYVYFEQHVVGMRWQTGASQRPKLQRVRSIQFGVWSTE